MALTTKQKLFVTEYLVDLNASKAALRAGYSPKSYPRIAQDLMAKPGISAAISKAMQQRMGRTNMDADRVLKEVSRIAFSDPRAVIGKSGAMLSAKEWTDDLAASISSVKITAIKTANGEIGTIQEIKFWDKVKALDLAMKHLGLNAPKKIEVSGSIDAQIEGFEVVEYHPADTVQ